MKQLVKLANEADSLKSYANELESSIKNIGSDYIVLDKDSVIDTMKCASKKMRQVAELIDGVSVKDNDSEIVSSRDAAVLNYLKSNLETFQENNEKLSVVLGELVKMLNLDGSGVDVYLLHYVSDVMQSHRELLTEIEDIDYKV